MYNAITGNNHTGLQCLPHALSTNATHLPRISQLSIADETYLPRNRPFTIPDAFHPPRISQLTITDGTNYRSPSLEDYQALIGYHSGPKIIHPSSISLPTLTEGPQYRPPCLGDHQALTDHDSGRLECSKSRRRRRKKRTSWFSYEGGRYGFGFSERKRLTFRFRGPQIKFTRFFQLAVWPFGRNEDWWG